MPIPESTRKILIVDDTPDGREPLARLLRMSGYQVDCAGDGIEALRTLQQQPADLVLLDLMMPGMSGLQVLERMRADARWRATPVIMFSASATDASRTQKLAALGVSDYLQKAQVPFDELLERVEKALSQAAGSSMRQ
jgi:CheY-like chemotaxis protein